MNATPTRLIDIPSTILAILLVIGGIVLLFFGKIDYVELSFFIVTAVGLIAGTAALKAPSPAQSQQLSTLAETAQAHTEQITATQQQLGHVQDLAVQAVTTASQVQQQQQQPQQQSQQQQQTPQQQQQDMVKLSTMPMTAMPATTPQFMQPVPQPVLYIDYGRNFGESDGMSLSTIQTQKVPVV